MPLHSFPSPAQRLPRVLREAGSPSTVEFVVSLRSLFEDHPASVGETYWQHLASAWGFAWRMAVASIACLIHALLPFMFEKYGSQTITRLYDRMVVNRHRQSGAPARAEPPRVEGERSAA